MTTASRRSVLKGLAAGGALASAGFPRLHPGADLRAHPPRLPAAPHRHRRRLRPLVRAHRPAALQVLNDAGGINGRPVEIVFEDDGTDPKRGAEVVEKFAADDMDVVFGTLFSHVVMGSAPRAGELRMPYLVCSEGHHVASGALNRWTLQPGITDVKSQVQAMAPWVAANLGKKVTLIYPDYAFGYDHRDFFSAAMQDQGGEIVELLAIPPTETSFTRYLPRIPNETEVLYHVMVGPAVLTFVKELGEFYGTGDHPEISASSTRSRPSTSQAPASSSSRAPTSGRATPLQAAGRRRARDLLPRGRRRRRQRRLAADPKDVSTYAHMFSAWETLFVIKAAMEAAGYQGPDDRQAFVEAIEAMTDIRPAKSTRRATRSSTARPTRSSATSRSPRSKAASSPSSTPPRSRTASTPTRSTTRRVLLTPWTSARSSCSRRSRASSWPRSSR